MRQRISPYLSGILYSAKSTGDTIQREVITHETNLYRKWINIQVFAHTSTIAF